MSHVYFEDVFDKKYKKTFKDVEDNRKERLELFTEPVQLTYVMIHDNRNSKPSYTVTLYTKTIQISIDEHLHITNDLNEPEEIIFGLNNTFYLNLHDIEFIKVTIKKRKENDVLYKILELNEKLQPFNTGDLDNCSELKKYYDDEMKKCKNNIDVCDRISNGKIYKFDSSLLQKEIEYESNLQQKQKEYESILEQKQNEYEKEIIKV